MPDIQGKLNRDFTISLESNPTTGYSWEAKFDPSIFQLKDKAFEKSPSDAIGSGGMEKFTYLPLKKGEAEITMIYKRPWESTAADTRSFKVTIT